MSITPCFIVHSLSPVQLFVTPWTATQQASLSFTIYWTCSNSCPLSLWCYLIISSSAAPFSSCPQSFLSIRVFSNESALCIWWPKKVLDLQLQHPSFQWYSGLISFRINWLDLLAVQGTLRKSFNTTIRKHQFFGTEPSLWSNSYIHIWLLEKP